MGLWYWLWHTDNIELNISNVAADTGAASQELTTAAAYQRRAGRRAACLALILAVVVAFVLLAVRPGTISMPGAFTHNFVSFVQILS